MMCTCVCMYSNYTNEYDKLAVNFGVIDMCYLGFPISSILGSLTVTSSVSVITCVSHVKLRQAAHSGRALAHMPLTHLRASSCIFVTSWQVF